MSVEVHNPFNAISKSVFQLLKQHPNDLAWRGIGICMIIPGCTMNVMFSNCGWGEFGNFMGGLFYCLPVITVVTGNPIFTIPSIIFTGGIIGLNTYYYFNDKGKTCAKPE